MESFRYCAPTFYQFGRDTEKLTGPLTAETMNCRKVLLCSGGGSAERSGLLGRVRRSLDDSGISYVELKGIQPNPLDDKVYEGISLVRDNGLEGLVAVGGGSVVDTAKAIAAGAIYEGDFWDFFSGKPVEKALPVGVVLTIPAAGSEGSGNCVITKADGMRKISIRTDLALRPRFAVMNPELTFTLPPEQTAAGVADMMAHIMERYFTPTQGVDVTDRLAEGLLKAIIDCAPVVMREPDNYDARANIMWAGTQAHNGLCGCGRREDWTSHAMEHEISALYGVTHGAGLATVFPAWITFMSMRSPSKPAQLARRVFGVNNPDDRAAALEGVSCLRAFFASLGLPLTFADLGISDPDIDLMVKKLHENKGATIGGYMPLTATETTEIYSLMI